MENTEHSTRKRYSKEFKLEAVRMLEAGDRSGEQIEHDLGIGSGQLYKWRKELAASGQRAFPGNGTPRDEELVRLRKEVASLREDREILRKVVAMFSKPSR
jgi:transposase